MAKGVLKIASINLKNKPLAHILLEKTKRLTRTNASAVLLFKKRDPLSIYQTFKEFLKSPNVFLLFYYFCNKTTTIKMVKALKLTEMEAIDAETMPNLFRKLKE